MKQIKNANQLFLCVIVFYLAASFLLRNVTLPLNLSLVMGEILVAAPVVLWSAAARTNPLAGIPAKPLKPSVIALLIVFAYCMLPVIAVINLISMLFFKNYVADVVGLLGNNPLILNLLFMAVAPCVVEELIFRGIFYRSYKRRGPWIGILFSGLLFGLMHMNFNQFCYAFVMGMVFAVLMESTGSIFAPMLVHFTFNANSVLLSWLTRGMNGAAASPDIRELLAAGGQQPGLLLGLAIIIAMFGMLALAGAGLCLAIVVAVNKICRSEEHMAALFSKRRNAVSTESGQRVMDIYLISAIVISVGFMIWRVLGGA